MAWIYDKNGQQKCEVKRLSYNGVFMDVSSITVTVESTAPIDFGIGDYIDWDYDGLRYTLDTAAGVEKQARRNSVGNAFTYENLVFLSPLSAAGNADFFDVILGNTNDFLTNTEFSFYGTAWDYAKRLEANLCRLYGEGTWKVRIWTSGTCYDTTPATGIDTGSWENKLVDVSGIKCLDGFQQMYDLWGCAYVFSVVSGVNYVDFYDKYEDYAAVWSVEGDPKIFAYGKSNGLYKIRHTQDADHVLVTRLRAYGSSENIPANYYLNSPDYHVDGNESSELAISRLMLPASQWTKDGVKSPANAYLEQNADIYGVREGVVSWDGSDPELGEIKPTIYKLTIQDLLDLMSDGDSYRPVEEKWPDTTQRIDKIITGAAPTDNGAVAEAGYDFTVRESWGNLTEQSLGTGVSHYDVEFNDLVMGLTPSVSHLAEYRIVPSTQNKVAVSFGVTDIVANNIKSVRAYLTPYVGGVKVENSTLPCLVEEDYGSFLYPKKYNISLHDVTGNPLVFSTMMTGAVTFRIVAHVEFNNDTGGLFTRIRNQHAIGINLIRGNKAIDKFFSVTIPQLGFDLSAAVANGGKLCMRSGANQPREFQIEPSSVRYMEETDTWYLRCKRSVDQSTQTYYPNSDSVIAAGDEYYLTGIPMPSLYVEIAAQKLLAAATAWLNLHSKPRMLSSVDVDNKIMAVEGIVLKEGMSLPISDTDLGIDPQTQESRIIDNIRIEEGTDAVRTFSITLRDKKEKSSLDAAIRGATSDLATTTSVKEAVSNVETRDHDALSGRDVPNQHPISSITGLEEALAQCNNFFELDGNGNVKLKDVYGGLWANGFGSFGGLNSGGGGGGVDIARVWQTLQNNPADSGYENAKIATAHLPVLNAGTGIIATYTTEGTGSNILTKLNLALNGVLFEDDDRLLFVDPEEGQEVIIDDPGTTGTVLWGAESANNVSLDVNGVSKMLVKQAALDGINSSISNLSSLIGTKQDYISDLSSIRSNASLGATAYNWGDHRTFGYATQSWVGQQGYLTSVPTASANTLGIIRIGTGLTIDGNGIVSVTGQTQGTVTGVKRASDAQPFSPDVNGVVTLPDYPVVPTAVSAFTNDAGYITKAVNDLVNYYTKSETYDRATIDSLIGSINQFHYEIYPSTSSVTNPKSNVLYLIGPTGSGSDKYEEYVYVSGNWTKIGDTSIDLAPYLTIASAQATYQPIISNLQTIIARADEGHTVYGYFSNGILGLEHIPLDERLSYVDPEEGEEITIDVPGTTGTVLWGAESQYNVALDVNGVSKMLLKAGALDNVYTRLGSLEANFVNGYAINALQLEGHGANFFATASGLSSLASTVAGLVTGVSSVVGQGGDVTVSQIASALTSAGYKLTDTIYTLPEATSGALGGIKIGYSESGRNYAVQLSDGKAFVNVPWTDTVYTLPTASRDVLGGIKIGNGLAIDSNGVVSVTGQTQGTVTRVDVGSTQYEPNVDGIVSLPAYPTTLPASDVYAWAKAASKPSYAFSEITGSATASQLPAIENLTHFGTRVYDASASRTANTVLAAPNGSNGAATFRALVAADIPSITTGKISDLERWIDDKEFITKAVNNLTNYYKKTETYTQSEVNALIAAINQFHYEIAASTSAVTDPKSNVLYLIGPTGSGSDKYEEYVYTTQWVKIGDTSIDLTPYLLASVAAQTYVPLTRTINGHALSADVTVTKGDVGLGNVDNLAASAYFTEFANGTGADANKVLITIGTTQKKLTVAFASNSDTLDGHDSAYFATASDVNTLFSYFDANGVANSAARLSGASALNIWGVEYWANGVPKAVTGRPNLYLARTQVNTSAANDTLLGITAISNASSSGDSDKSRIVWDAGKEAWHFIGNVYADGFISAGGLNEGGSGGGVDLSRVWQSLSNSAATFTPGDNSKIATAHLPSLSGTGVSAQYSSTGSGATLATVLSISLVASGVTAGTYTKVTVDQYGRATAGTTLAASDIPTLAISKISGLQTALDNKQPLDADLTAIAGLSGTSGFLKKTAANTWTLDTNTYALASSLDNYVPTSRTVNGKALSANISLAAADLSDAARLLFVDPEEGEEVTIEDPGTTGTVLWGAESANQVALDVNGVSKTLVKMQALDGIRSSITTILGYFSGSSAYNALALEGHSSSYFATSTALSDLSSAVSALVTGVSSVAGKTGAVSLVITDIGGLQDALNGKQAAGNYVNTIGGKYGVITLGSGLEMSDSGELSVTGQTIGTVTSVGLSMPTGFSVASSPITSSGTLAVSFASGYSLPSDAAQAAWTAKYDKPSGGIPKTDLASAVQTSLGLADSALQSHQTVTLASGTNNGTLKITTAAGTTDNVAVTGLGTAAYRGVATTIGASITNLVPGSLLYSVLGGAFDSSNTVVDFVNSSIATATATFRGTNDSATTEADFLTWANALTKTLNDYVFWKTTDSTGNVVFKRYKYGYDGTEAGSLAWRYEYDLNNSSFTAAQWSAINSGITSTLVTAFNAKYDKPVGGIPKTDLASAVQTSLGLADTALQSHQTIYSLTIKNSQNVAVLTYNPKDDAGSLILGKAMVGLGNVENTALSTWNGTQNITTLGTITTGVWHGSQITQDYLSDIGWTFVRNSATYDTEDYIHVNS